MKERITRHLEEVKEEQEDVESDYRYDANMNTDTFFKRFVFKEDAQRVRDHLEEKHNDIAKIEKDLVELNGIMQDIGQLVEYHNELLNQIEMNVDESKAKMTLGTPIPSSLSRLCVCGGACAVVRACACACGDACVVRLRLTDVCLCVQPNKSWRRRGSSCSRSEGRSS
jgi:hypothetical protein